MGNNLKGPPASEVLPAQTWILLQCLQFKQVSANSKRCTEDVEHSKNGPKGGLAGGGLGMPMLPASKAAPKEIPPILNKPMIQYAVEECLVSGMEGIIVIRGTGKSSTIEDHFATDPDIPSVWDHLGHHELAEEMRRWIRSLRLRFVRQEQPLGLGHAVMRAKPLAGCERFTILLCEIFLLGPRPALAQWIEARADRSVSVVAVEHIPIEPTNQCRSKAVLAWQRVRPVSIDRKAILQKVAQGHLELRPKTQQALPSGSLVG